VRNNNILIIEDDRDIRAALSQLLEMEGYHVETADDGDTGLDKIKAGFSGVILLDLFMPKVNGYQVLDTLRREDALEPLKLIVMSAAPPDRLPDVEHIIRKPLSIDTLLNKITVLAGTK